MIQGVDANALKSVRRVSLIEVRILRGDGTPDNPAREVVMLFNDAGECVAEHDQWWPTPWYAPEDELRKWRQRP